MPRVERFLPFGGHFETIAVTNRSPALKFKHALIKLSYSSNEESNPHRFWRRENRAVLPTCVAGPCHNSREVCRCV